MKNDNKPSIYSDRTTIGSPSELDEYGVWVKSEPQDLSQAAQAESVDSEAPGFSADISGLDDMDLGIPDIEDLPDFDDLEEQASASGIKSTVTENISDDDFDIPDIDIDETDSTEEEDDGNVFNFGDLTGAGTSSASLDSANFLKSEEPMGFPSFSDDTDIEETGSASDTVEFYDTSETNDTFKDVLIDDISMDSGTAGITAKSETKDTTSGLSNQLLMKIAEELASIRSELSSLKKEFSGLKAQVPSEEAAGEDFFGSEDDEKISLTGDELNNILNTADFTEEAGADATEQLSGEIDTRASSDSEDADSETLSINDLDMEISLDDSTDQEANGDSALFDQNFEEVDISIDDLSPTEEIKDDQNFVDIDSSEALPDFSIGESEELKTIMEEGIAPMTPAPDPEDANYLAADPNAGETKKPSEESLDTSFDDFLMDTDDMDLSDAVIDEPDLSSGIQDNPVEEPTLDDISINLDLTELELDSEDSGDTDSEIILPDDDFVEQEEEITLPVDDFEEDVHSLISEAFVNEAESSQPSIAEAAEDELIPEDELGILGAEEIAVPETAETSTAAPNQADNPDLPSNLKNELKTVLSYMDQLLDSLPDDKIEEFAQSDYYDTYKKLFKELGIV